MFMMKNLMKSVLACAIVGSAIVACTDENASVIPDTTLNVPVSSIAAIPASSSSFSTAPVPESISSSANEVTSSSIVAFTESSSSVASSVESSSSEVGGVESSSSAVADTIWHQANLTWYTSWPEPGSEECIEYNGCTWAGYFAGVEGQMTEEWVSQHNIIAVHEKDFEKYKLKTFRLRMNGSTIDAMVYDMCSDSDCDGCCTENAGEIGFLIDIEKYTRERFDGNGDGVVEWTCLDCE